MSEENDKEVLELLRDRMSAKEPENDPRSEPQEFLTPDEAAKLLRVNIGTLYEVIKTAGPPWAKPIGKQIRISRSALLKWFEQEVAAPRRRRAL